MPWEPSIVVDIPDEAAGSWEVPSSEAPTAPGRYQVSLGINDPWTGELEPASEAIATVDLGDVDEWTRHILFSDPGPTGYLYRRLLAHYTRRVAPDAAPDLDDASERRGFAVRALRARRVLLEDESAHQLRRELDTILSHLPLDDVLAAIASHPKDFDARAVIRSRLFSRPWGDASPVSPADDLWHIWRPLGAWTDLRLRLASSASAEARLRQRLGDQQLRLLSPLQPGSNLVFWDPEADARVSTRIVTMETDTDLSPFDVAASRYGVSLLLKGESPQEFNDCRMHAERDATGRWQFEPSDDDGTVPPCLARLGSETTIEAYYPAESVTYGTHPDPPIVNLVHAGNWIVLDAIHAYCVQLPGSPLSQEAFTECCLRWARRVAEDAERRHALVELCKRVGLAIANDLDHSRVSPRTKAEWRIMRELTSRWF